MCGIAGGLFWDDSISTVEATGVVRSMVTALAHRGPDGNGVFVSTPESGAGGSTPLVVLGHTRLAILDVSDAGAQPMGGRDGSPCISYNGEAYNFAELRLKLERAGAHFTSRTDTEVLLRGYDAWGAGLLPRLRGMFAFGLWDPRRQQLLLARDRLGIKPLYYFRGERCLLFSSEVRALLATELVPRRLNPTALWQYLGYQAVPAPLTFIEGVRALEPGHYMTVGRNGAADTHEYWNMLDAATEPTDIPAEEARRRIGDLLRDAVSSHMVSDVPVGAFLSGGIDSSAVVALMRETGHLPRTFSVGFGEATFDESRHAETIANLYGAEHTHIPLRADDLLAELPAAVSAMDQPTGDGINTYIVSRAVRARGISVALSGLGGDELFGGYPSFARLSRIANMARVWGRSPDSVRSLAASAVRTLGGASVHVSKTAAAIASDGSMASMFPLTRQLLSAGQRSALLGPAVLAHIGEGADPYERLLASAYRRHPSADSFAQISYAEARTYMHDVLLRDTDQMSMAHALEVRVPLLDHRLVDAVMALPGQLKASGTGIPKPLLVESLHGLLPDSIVRRPKQGFTLPFDPWMRGPLRSYCEEHLGDEGLSGRGIVNPDEVQRLWQSFLSGGSEVSWSRLWTLVVLDAWLDDNGAHTRHTTAAIWS